MGLVKTAEPWFGGGGGGLDCPYQATMVDILVLVGIGSVLLLPGAMCVFEEAQGTPLKASQWHWGSFLWWFGQLRPRGQVGVISGQL